MLGNGTKEIFHKSNSPFYLLIHMNTNSIKSYNLCDYFLSRVQEILKKKKKRKENLEAALKSLKNQLINFGASKIILFGSLNSGDIEVNSDLDLFVLMPSTKTGKLWKFIFIRDIKNG
jgi:predicted nucleotidyltransferase